MPVAQGMTKPALQLKTEEHQRQAVEMLALSCRFCPSSLDNVYFLGLSGILGVIVSFSERCFPPISLHHIEYVCQGLHRQLVEVVKCLALVEAVYLSPFTTRPFSIFGSIRTQDAQRLNSQKVMAFHWHLL
eukprot:5407136-Amphidinium_carterae.1